MKYLWDTSTAIYYLRGNQAVIAKAKKINAVHIYICHIVIGELIYGAFISSKPNENHQILEQFLKSIKIFPMNDDVAYNYARIKTALKNKGTLIKENDIWIAAYAKSNHAIIVTTDQHFNQIKECTVEKWI